MSQLLVSPSQHDFRQAFPILWLADILRPELVVGAGPKRETKPLDAICSGSAVFTIQTRRLPVKICGGLRFSRYSEIVWALVVNHDVWLHLNRKESSLRGDL